MVTPAPAHPNEILSDEEKESVDNTKSDEPPSKKTKHEVGNVDSGDNRSDKKAEDVVGDLGEVRASKNEGDEDVEDECDCASAPSSPESGRWTTQKENAKCYHSNQVLQPSVIDVMRKSSSELLTSLKRYYDTK